MNLWIVPALAAIFLQSSSIQPTQVFLASQTVKVQIQDGVATTEVDQVFQNPTPGQAEATFLFPIPPDTAVRNLTLFVNGEPLQAEMLDAKQARRIYEEIVRSRRDPGLLEYAGQGLIRASIFPISPNGSSQVVMKYSTTLPVTGGMYDYQFPLRIASLSTQQLRSLVFDITISSSRAIQTIFSPTHKVGISQKETADGKKHQARVSLEGNRSEAEKNFRLLYGTENSEFGINVLSHGKKNAPGFFMLFLSPQRNLPQNQTQPKDVVFVLDTSGSMSGEKLDQAKQALKFCLRNLNPKDRFNIIPFSTASNGFQSPLADASAENVEKAAIFVDELKAVGGTNIDEALQTALTNQSQQERLFFVLLMTDGLPTVGVTDADEILANARARNSSNSRIFTLGIGHDVNTRLLDTLAEDSRAARDYIRPGEDIELAISNLYQQIANPVLANPVLKIDGAEVLDMYPSKLPDLFQGTQLVLMGRYRTPGKHTVRLSGDFLGGKREWSFDAEFTNEGQQNDFIAPLWANRKVGYLLDQIRIHGSNQELVNEIVQLGKQYGIVTPYTSHLVVEETQRLRRDLNLQPQVIGDKDEHDSAAQDARKKLDGLVRPSGPTTGAGAVTASETLYHLKSSSGFLSSNNELGLERMQIADKLFFKLGEIWVDSKLQKEDFERTQKIAFLGETYFELLGRFPELSRILALGPKMIFLWEGAVYEVN